MPQEETIIRRVVKKWSKKKSCNYLSVQMDGIGWATCWNEDIFQDVQECRDTGEKVFVDITESDYAQDRQGEPFKYLDDLSRAGEGQKKMNDPNPASGPNFE